MNWRPRPAGSGPDKLTLLLLSLTHTDKTVLIKLVMCKVTPLLKSYRIWWYTHTDKAVLIKLYSCFSQIMVVHCSIAPIIRFMVTNIIIIIYYTMYLQGRKPRVITDEEVHGNVLTVHVFIYPVPNLSRHHVSKQKMIVLCVCVCGGGGQRRSQHLCTCTCKRIM